MRPNEPFHILFVDFGDHAIDLLPHQVVAYASQHPEILFESEITNAEMLGLILDDTYTKYRKIHTNVRHIDTITKHLADQRENHMGADEKPLSTDDFNRRPSRQGRRR